MVHVHILSREVSNKVYLSLPGSVRCLTYDRERRILFSGGFDQIVILWDIGSQKGTAFELTGHK